MMSKENLELIKKFNNLPETPEVMEIKEDYLSDKDSTYEFFCRASNYLENNT